MSDDVKNPDERTPGEDEPSAGDHTPDADRTQDGDETPGRADGDGPDDDRVTDEESSPDAVQTPDDDQGPDATDGPVDDDVSPQEAPVSVDALINDGDEGEEPATGDAGGLVGILEALIFASPEPITPKQLVKLLDSEPKEDVLAAIDDLKRRYTHSGGLQLVEVAGGYQIVTRPELHEWVRRLFHERTTQKLSVQALETLAVIAYKQPITAMEVAEIRGVNTSGVVGTLLERSLVKISGRKQVVGRPFLYSTTRDFLERFGLNDLSDLPKVDDMADALGFEPPVGLAEQAMLMDQPATPEDQQVLSGEEPGDEPSPSDDEPS